MKHPKLGDIFGSKNNAYNERLHKERQIVNSNFKRLPRKLKKRLKNIEIGKEFEVISVVNSGGSHTLTLKPI